MKAKLMLIGAGELGGTVLEFLARDPSIGEVVVGGRHAGRAEARCNLARLGAVAQGFAPAIRFVPLDLNEPDALAEAVGRERPDLIFSAATLQAWWLLDLLPEQERAYLKGARFGAWLPIHLALSLKLMRALRQARFGGVVLTAPYPDVINCVLGRLQLAPTCGVGNIAEIVPKVRLLAAARLKAPVESIRAVLVAHHALEPLAFAASAAKPADVPPHHLRVYRGDKDVTEEAGAEELLVAPCALPDGPAWSFLTAGATVRLIRAVLGDEETALHAPGPHGLPGGYPILAGRRTVRVAEIDGLTQQEAVSLNERAHLYDGIEQVEADGTVVFRGETVAIMRQALGYDCERLPPDEAEPRAAELMTRFREYATHLGVKLPGRQ